MSVPMFEERPWGRFDLINRFDVPGENSKPLDVFIKKIEILPGMRLSYQAHKGRDEHWYVLSGKGFAVIDDQEIRLAPGDYLTVKRGQKHRVGSDPDQSLIFVEIATGDVDEADTVRYDDDFGRAK